MSPKSLKNAVVRAADGLAAEAIEVSDRIWEYAEEPFKEFQSAHLMRQVLERHGFAPSQEFANIPTAFALAAGKGKPRIGILAEYDALPDCGLDNGTWGHGCGHNLLGAGSMLAALAARQVMDAQGIRGTVVLYGCPAEETVAGKVYMARDGAFADLDVALSWHPSASNHIGAGGGSAVNSYAFEFFGKTAHGASAHAGRSALDGIELMDHAINILREHIPENIRIHSVITHGGGAPNVVPEYARSWLYVRAKDRKQVDEISKRVIKCARGAATATETRCKVTLLTGVYSRLVNNPLAEAFHAALKAVGPPPFDAKDERLVKKMKHKGELVTKIGDINRGQGRASSDWDSVSWLAPFAELRIATQPKGITGHHRDSTRFGNTPIAHKGMVHAGKVMALTALSLMTDRKTLGAIRREFRKGTKNFTYDPLVPKRQNPPIRDLIPKHPPMPPEELR